MSNTKNLAHLAAAPLKGKLKASDPEASDSFGAAVTISSDGNTAIVGAHLEDTTATNSGSVYVFVQG